MKLRSKLSLPIIFFMLTTLFVVHFVVLPGYFSNKKQDVLASNTMSLGFVSSSLVPLILSSDYAAIKQTLDTAKLFVNKEQKIWSSIQLYSVENTRLYPLREDEIIPENNIELAMDVLFDQQLIGQIKLFVNLEQILAPIEKKIVFYEQIFISLFVIFILLTWKMQEKIIISPIYSLVRATNRLAKGDYNFRLLKAGEDEIGQLIDNFDVMRFSIKENQDKFSVLFRQAADPSLLVVGQAIVDCNERALILLNYSLEEIKQIPVSDLFDGAFDFGGQEAVYNNDKINPGQESVVFNRFGASTPVAIYVNVIKNDESALWMLTLHDLSEQKKSEEKIKTSEERLKLGLENSNTGLWDYYVQKQKVYFNTQFLTLIGYVKSEKMATMHSWIELVHPDDISSVKAVIEDHFKQRIEKIFSIHRLKHENKTWRWVQLEGKAIQFSSSGSPLRVVGTLIDITERVQNDMALRKARDEAENSAKVKSQFLANMSHEIRTPMNGVLGMLHLLAGTTLEAKQAEYVNAARKSASSLLTIINDILDFSKIESGQLLLENITFDFYELINDVCSILTEQATNNNVELIIDYDLNASSNYLGDPTRVRQILLNLASNAIKFAKNGEVIFRIKQPGPNVLHIEVEDNGIGISLDDQIKLFQPFTQADGTTTRKFGGTGLGLSICKRLVELMKGNLTLESQIGHGSIFKVTLPLAAQPGEQRVIQSANSKIVLLYKNRLAAGYIQNQLERMRFEVEAQFSLEVDSIAESVRNGFSTILMDNSVICECDEVCLEKFAEIVSQQNVTVIGLANVSEEEHTFFDRYGRFVLTKPFRDRYFSQLIDRLCRGSDIKDSDGNYIKEDKKTVSAELSGKRILLAEDIEVNQLVAMEFLKAMGAEVILASNGKEAYDKCVQRDFDCILMDCQMPEMDGFEATRLIRVWEKEHNKKPAPIIALTANAMKEDRQNCLSAGMNDFITKPVEPENLKDILTSWIFKPSRQTGEINPAVTMDKLEVDNQSINSVVDGVDTQKVIMLKTLMKEKFATLVETFNNNQAKKISDLWQCYQSQNHEDAYKLLHGLKGSSANLGAVIVAADCAALEEKVKHGKFELKDVELYLLEKHCKLAVEKISQLSQN